MLSWMSFQRHLRQHQQALRAWPAPAGHTSHHRPHQPHPAGRAVPHHTMGPTWDPVLKSAALHQDDSNVMITIAGQPHGAANVASAINGVNMVKREYSHSAAALSVPLGAKRWLQGAVTSAREWVALARGGPGAGGTGAGGTGAGGTGAEGCRRGGARARRPWRGWRRRAAAVARRRSRRGGGRRWPLRPGPNGWIWPARSISPGRWVRAGPGPG